MACEILLIEDDVDVAEALTDILSLEGYSVNWSRNGREALEFLATGAIPKLILLDMMMPVMNGAEFRAVQLGDPRIASIPTILTSAGGAEERMAQMLKANGKLRKPMSIDHLLETVARYCPRGE